MWNTEKELFHILSRGSLKTTIDQCGNCFWKGGREGNRKRKRIAWIISCVITSRAHWANEGKYLTRDFSARHRTGRCIEWSPVSRVPNSSVPNLNRSPWVTDAAKSVEVSEEEASSPHFCRSITTGMLTPALFISVRAHICTDLHTYSFDQCDFCGIYFRRFCSLLSSTHSPAWQLSQSNGLFGAALWLEWVGGKPLKVRKRVQGDIL